jgi:hypothetical protein
MVLVSTDKMMHFGCHVKQNALRSLESLVAPGNSCCSEAIEVKFENKFGC